MFFNRQAKAIFSWIACFAILLSALAPAISHAVQRNAPEGWTEICTLTGARMVRIEAEAASGSSTESPELPTAHALKHCPYCAAHVTVLGLPPAAPARLSLTPLAFHVPELFLRAPRTLFVWASAQPRAPPLQA